MARENITQEQAMTRICRAVRNYTLRTMESTLATLTITSSSGYPALFAGHAEEKLPLAHIQKSTTPFIFVAAGCFRAMDVAAQLTQGSLDQIKKIFIVDNSQFVVDFWKLIKGIFLLSENEDELNQHIQQNQNKFKSLGYQHIFDDITWKLSDDCLPYCLSSFQLEFYSFHQLLNTLIQVFSFESLKQLIKRVTTVRHDWTLKNCMVFDYIRTYAERAKNPLYLYATDIVACVEEEKGDVDQLFSNIRLLNPQISVYRSRRKAFFFGHSILYDSVKHPDHFHVFSGTGNTSELKNKVGYIENDEYECFRSSMEVIKMDWENALACLQIKEIPRAIVHFKNVEEKYTALLFERCTYIERYCQDYILARALGFALLQNSDDSGIAYLEKSASAIKKLYGDCEYTRRYECEINQFASTYVSRSTNSVNIMPTIDKTGNNHNAAS